MASQGTHPSSLLTLGHEGCEKAISIDDVIAASQEMEDLQRHSAQEQPLLFRLLGRSHTGAKTILLQVAKWVSCLKDSMMR
jgi:hypothetical protein